MGRSHDFPVAAGPELHPGPAAESPCYEQVPEGAKNQSHHDDAMGLSIPGSSEYLRTGDLQVAEHVRPHVDTLKLGLAPQTALVCA